MAVLWMSATGQQVTVLERTRLLPNATEPVYYPVLDRTGTQLLYSSGPSLGLNLLDLNARVSRVVTTQTVAGHDAFFGGDGNVYYVSQRRGDDKLVYRSAYMFDPSTGTTTQLAAEQHGAMRPVEATQGVAVVADGRLMARGLEKGTAVWTVGDRLYLIVDGQQRVFSPVEAYAGYLWASLSPNGQRVAFFAAGKGIIVTDLRGQIVAMLGNYEMPSWLDDDYIVAQHATDDGHQFTSSQVVLLKADGTWQHALTEPSSMTMHPSAAAGSVAYTTIDGHLYLMRIAINDEP